MALEHVETHLRTKHEIRCSKETLEPILQDHELVPYESLEAFKKDMTTPETAIDGILVEKGYKCMECGHCTSVWRLLTEDFLW